MEMGNVVIRIVDGIIIGLVWLISALSRVLPAWVLYWFFKLVSYALYYARPRMRRNLQKKISDAMPEMVDGQDLARLGREAFSALFLPTLDTVLFDNYGERFMRELEIEGMENLEKAEAEGKGLLVMTMHQGALPLLRAVMAGIGKPYTFIQWHPETHPLPRYATGLYNTMQKAGGDPEVPVIWAGAGRDVIGPVREVLARKRRVGMAIDVLGKCVVPYFGRPAALTDGIAHFSCDSGAPILPMIVLRIGRAAKYRLIIHEPVIPEHTGDRKADVHATMVKAAAAGEMLVREAPEQYMSWIGLWQLWDEARELEGK